MITRILLIAAFAITALAGESTPRAVNTIAELATLTPVASKPKVEVLGYYAPGDGGGGVYYATNTATGTNAYGGRIRSGKAGWSWQLDAIEINARQFGAKGDGVSDDVSSLNTWITYQTNNWRNVKARLTPGSYNVTSPVIFGSNLDLTADNGAELVRGWSQIDGEGKRMAVMRNLSWEGLTNGITYERDTNIVIRGLKIRNPYNPGSTTNALYRGGNFAAYYVADLQLIDCTFENAEYDWNCTLWGNRLRVINPTVIGSRDVFEDGIHFLGGTNIAVIGGQIECGDDAIAFTSFNNVLLAQAQVTGVKTHSWRGHSFRVSPETGWTTVTETNYIGDITVDGLVGSAGLLKNGAIQIREYPVTSTPLRMLKNISVRRARINMGDMTGRADTQIASWPVSIGGATNVLIDDVRCWPSYKDSLYIEYSQDVLVQNSRFESPYDTNDVAVDVVGSDRVRLINNTIINTNGNNSIVFRQGGTDWRLIENDITAGTSGVYGLRFFNAGTESARLLGNTFYGPGGGVQLSLANMAALAVLDNRFDSSVGTEVQLNGSSVPATMIVSNNDGYTYPTPVTQLWGANTGSASTQLKVVRTDTSDEFNMRFASDRVVMKGLNTSGFVFSVKDADATSNPARLEFEHYTSAEEPVTGIFPDIGLSANTLNIGGGTGLGNAATRVSLWGASATTTTSGTELARLDLSGSPATRDSALMILDRDAGTLRRVGVTNLDVGDGVTRSYLYLK